MVDRAEAKTDPIDDRSELAGPATPRRWIEDMLRRPVRPWPYFGVLALMCLALQAATGVLMAFSYQPTPDNAYVSVYYISNVMPYGWLVRTIHSWGAVLVVAFVALHAVQVFLTGSYRQHHEGKWVLGILALGTTLAFAFTGHLLPWDQKAYWSTEAAVSLVRQVPGVGERVAGLMLGGESIGAATLTRFSAAHIMLLPALLVGLLVVHVRAQRARQLTRLAEDAADALEADGEDASGTVPFYPDLFMSWATTAALLLSVYVVLAILLPASIDVKADPSVMPQAIKPTWHFLSLYALSRYLPSGPAATLPFVLGILFALMPVLDRSRSQDPKDRVFALAFGSSIIAAILALTLAGALL